MDALVTTNPDIFGGMPVFAGSRLPIAVVLDSLAEGSTLEQLQDHWPFLTEAHIQAARAYSGPWPLVPPKLSGGRVISRHVIDADEVLGRLQSKLDAAEPRLRRSGVP